MKGTLAVAASIAIFALVKIAGATGPTQVSGAIEHDTTWEEGNSPYLVQGNLTVKKGFILTLKPGVVVRFQGDWTGKGGVLLVQGGLVAQGDEGRPVNLSQASGTTGWGGIYFDSSDPKNSVLRRCVIISGQVAVRDSSPVIEQCSLYGAACALNITGTSSPSVVGNRITANTVGMALTGPGVSPQVLRNTFYNNDYAVIAKDFDSPRITGNIFNGNKKYNLVNQSSKTLSAPWNDFRTADDAAIVATLFDTVQDPKVGAINFRPFAPPMENREYRTAQAPAAPKFQPRLALTLDGTYAKSQGMNVPLDLTNGLGNNLRVEYQFRSFMSVGVAFGYQAFVGQGKTGTAGSLDLMGRVIPFSGGGFESYLIGGAGINPLYNRDTTPWIGRWHAMAGLGTRYSLDSNWGIDVSGVYNFYTPMARHVDAFSVHMGVGYSFGL